MRISPLQIYQAKKRIAPWVTRTPLVRAHDFSELCGAEIWSKLEILQPTGAFKLRGATNTILQLNEDLQKETTQIKKMLASFIKKLRSEKQKPNTENRTLTTDNS